MSLISDGPRHPPVLTTAALVHLGLPPLVLEVGEHRIEIRAIALTPRGIDAGADLHVIAVVIARAVEGDRTGGPGIRVDPVRNPDPRLTADRLLGIGKLRLHLLVTIAPEQLQRVESESFDQRAESLVTRRPSDTYV